MMRVERLVTPEAKSFCSTSSVCLPARAHWRAMATPLIPPPITTTWKWRPSSGARCCAVKAIFYQTDTELRRGKDGLGLHPRILKFAPQQTAGEGNLSTLRRLAKSRKVASKGSKTREIKNTGPAHIVPDRL